MEINRGMHLWRIVMFGSINGLIFGFIAELLREKYVEFQVQRIVEESARDGSLQFQMIDPLAWQFVPTISVIIFSVTSYLLYRFWKEHLKSIILFWEAVAVVSATGFTLLYLANGPFINRQHLSDTFIFWFICLILAVFINSIYGMLIKLSCAKRSRNKTHLYK